MKKNKTLLLSLLLTSQAHAEWTSKEKTIAYTLSGCGGGFVAGSMLDSRDKSNSKSSQATIVGNALGGCLLGLAFGYFFVDDDQKILTRQLDQANNKVDELTAMIRSSTLKGSYNAKFLDSMEIRQNYKGDKALARMIDKNCISHKFYLGFDGREITDTYIPVDDGIIIKSLEYYLVRPRNRNDTSTVCVKHKEPFGYLNLEMQGFGKLLFEHATTTLKKKRGY